jgi:ferredoxin
MSPQHAPVAIDAELCVGHGRCYSKAPEMFYSDDLALGHVKDVVDDVEKPTDVPRIIRACPEGAIHLVETD